MPIALILGLLAAFLARDLAGAEGDYNVVSLDPYTNGTSYHSTEVQPDRSSFANTVLKSRPAPARAAGTFR